MMENDLIVSLAKNIEELGNIELNDALINLAIFNKDIEDAISKRLEFLKNDFDSKRILYNVGANMFSKQKEEILGQYGALLNKVSENFVYRFHNIQLELQEIESNQKIALANFSKVISDKNKNHNLSNELLRKYNKKARACLAKYNDYNELVNECLIEINICKKELNETLDKILTISQELELIQKQNKMQLFISKIRYIFNGRKKFENNIIKKRRNDISNIQDISEDITKETHNKTINFTATISAMRDRINQEFAIMVS